MAEQNRDSLFDKPKPSSEEIAAAKATDVTYSEIIGLSAFMHRFKIVERK
jgi:hypothetical protein